MLEFVFAMETNWLKKILPYLGLAGGILFLSLSSLFVRWAQAPGLITTFYRMLIASIVMTPIVLRGPIKELKGIKASFFIFPLLGGLFTFLDHGTWTIGISGTSVANATLLNNVAPIWVALFTVLILRNKLPGKFWLGLLLTMGGATFILGFDLLTQNSNGAGNLWSLGSSVAYAAYFLVTQQARRKFQALPYLWIATMVSATLFLILNLILGNSFTGYNLTTCLVFLGAGVISQIGGHFSLSYALGQIPASIVSPTLILQPVLTALLAIPLAGESLSWIQILGGCAVLLGILLVNRSQSTSK